MMILETCKSIYYHFSYFEGSIATSNNVFGNSYYTVTLNAFQTYAGYTQVTNGVGQSGNRLFWETSSVSQLIIPDDNYGYAEDIASSPYQITVE